MRFAGDIEAFVRVVEAGGFTPAARALGMTPSAVSKLVSRLEDRLGARLFRRTTRRLGLTEAGAAFHRHASRIVQDIADAELAVTRLSDAPRGLLRVSAAVTFGLHQIQPLVPEFLERYPEIRLDLSLSDVFVDLVQEGYDVAIRAGPLSDASLIARKLGDFGRVFVASPAYIERHGRPRAPDELKRHNCIMFAQPQLNQWPFRDPKTGRAFSVEVGGNVIANNGETVLQMAILGVGIARLGEFSAGPPAKAGLLAPLLEEFNSRDPLTISAVYPTRRHLPPKVTAFVDFLAAKFLPKPPWA
ncbi:MAG: LysR substrate-binding domain-containing protein [Rhodospirillales bacterium]